MERKFAFETDEYYHLYNRGTDKRVIFETIEDYLRFLVLLHVCNWQEAFHLSDWGIGRRRSPERLFDLIKIAPTERLINIGVYCLMPNHYHLLIRAREPEAVPRFALKFQTAYSMYFNKKRERSGNLFQGRFKAQHVDSDRYLHYLFAYIHLNPIKLKQPMAWERRVAPNKRSMGEFLKNYPYSSYSYYIGEPLPHCAILTPGAFPDYFPNRADFDSLVNDWLEFNVVKSQG